jgi:hypothetical protein
VQAEDGRDLGAVGLQLPKGYKAWVNIPKAFGAARASFTGQENALADAALRRLLVISRADPRGEHLGHPDEMTRLLLRMGQSPVLWDAETKKVGRLLRTWMWWKRQGQTLERTIKIAGMMHLDAEEIASRIRGCERQQVLAVAEADLDDDRRGAAELRGEVQRGRRRILRI